MRRSTLAALAVVASSVLGAAAIGAPQPAGGNKVLVIPFVSLNTPVDKQWISKAVQETLVADFGQSNAFSPVAFSGQVIVEDNATAARLAREASMTYAVRGSAQFVNNDVRLTAQLIDAKTGDTLSTGIATGRVDDLLKLEDDLANQLRVGPQPVPQLSAGGGTGYVPRSPAPVAGQTTPQAPAGPAVYNAPVYNDYQQAGTPAYYYSPVYSPSYLDYTTYQYVPDYSYPYYPLYPVGYFGGLGFNNGFCGFNHVGHHGFHGGTGFAGSFHSGGINVSFVGGGAHGMGGGHH